MVPKKLPPAKMIKDLQMNYLCPKMEEQLVEQIAFKGIQTMQTMKTLKTMKTMKTMKTLKYMNGLLGSREAPEEQDDGEEV